MVCFSSHFVFVFDVCQAALTVLAEPVVIFRFDPGQDCEPKLDGGVPGASVDDVSLEQGME